MRRIWLLLSVLAVLVACGAGLAFVSLAVASTHGTKVGVVLAPGGAGTKLAVRTGVAKAGAITFEVSNHSNAPGPYGVTNIPEVHELVVLKTNLAPNKLPVHGKPPDGTVAVEVGRIGRPLVVQPGKTSTITLNLKPGHYVLICNLPGHYTGGQHAAFRVTG